MQTTSINIRNGTFNDVSSLAAIEASCFADPWSEMQFRDYMVSKTNACRLCLVADLGGAAGIVGYVIIELRRRTIYILNIAVHPACQRHGVGSSLIDHLKRKLGKSPAVSDREAIRIDVCDTNLACHLFFKAQGFVAVNVMPRYFSGGQDAYALRFAINKRGGKSLREKVGPLAGRVGRSS